MIVRINDTVFENAKWSVNDGIGEFWFTTNEPLSHLEEILDPSVAFEIEILDDEGEVVERWYNRDLQELAYRKQDSGEWFIVAKFKVSIVDNDTEQKIHEDIDDSDDAIMELADTVSQNEEAIKALQESFRSQNNILSELATLYNDLADRVARLENAQ